MHSAPLLSAEGAKEAAHLLLADRRPVSAVPVARVDDDVVAEGAQLLVWTVSWPGVVRRALLLSSSQ